MVVFIRGLPGSGKSTYAKTHYNGTLHLEADMFFMKGNAYRYNGDHIKQAHSWCFNAFVNAVKSEMDVVVCNTFTTLSELNRYIEFCNKTYTPYKIITVTGNHTNIHGVPNEVMDKMKSRWQNIVGETIVRE